MLSAFHFQQGHSFLHHLDPRLKIGFFLVLQTLLVQASWTFIGLMTVCIIILGIFVRLHLGRLFFPLPGIYLLYLLTILLALFPLDPSNPRWQAGVLASLSYCSSLILMLALASIFLACTKVHDIQRSIMSLVRPLPVRLAWTLSLLLGLSFLFVPLLLDHIEQRRLAIQNRGGRFSNPRPARIFALIRVETIGLLEHAFLLARDIEDGLRIRGFDYLPKKLAPQVFKHSAYSIRLSLIVLGILLILIIARLLVFP